MPKILAQSVDELSDTQRKALEVAIAAKRTHDDRVRLAQDQVCLKVFEAALHGVPALILADELGVSRGRVYQMKAIAKEIVGLRPYVKQED